MNKVLRGLVFLLGFLFAAIALRWIADPAGAAQSLGMPLLDGVARSTQVGDMTAFFMLLAITILLAAFTLKSHWFYVPALLLIMAAAFRTLAWLIHGAALPVALIAPEVIIAVILWLSSKRLVHRASRLN